MRELFERTIGLRRPDGIFPDELNRRRLEVLDRLVKEDNKRLLILKKEEQEDLYWRALENPNPIAALRAMRKLGRWEMPKCIRRINTFLSEHRNHSKELRKDHSLRLVLAHSSNGIRYWKVCADAEIPTAPPVIDFYS